MTRIRSSRQAGIVRRHLLAIELVAAAVCLASLVWAAATAEPAATSAPRIATLASAVLLWLAACVAVHPLAPAAPSWFARRRGSGPIAGESRQRRELSAAGSS